ncbi:MAG: GNAT family N-acetyltransferase [Chitinophagaceae bacterium]|nr:GNAT family N-acetyltransferase [Chitinophagaceae bacterium]
MDLELCVIDYQSPLYPKVLALRHQVLRVPLGLNLYEEDLNEDKDQYIIIALLDQEVQACLMLKILDKDTIKLRQMAVADSVQKRGFGALLVNYAENFCVLNEYAVIELHARKEAMGFYLKLQYEQVGEEFEEVGIPHFKMIKHLQSDPAV